mmetsp:Transcript_16403/g.43344  ORF Transcript_16403/g.43344 Transcript_16403/m.43344 type:complete len:292 (-) Transcript_16403:4058-4933(-)
MNCEPWRLLAPSLPHICTKMRKQKKAKPSSPWSLSFSLTTKRLAGVFSACRNWLNWKSTLSESMMSSRYFFGSRKNEGTTSGCVVRMCARATSWRSASNCGASSSRNSLILPRAWTAMKVSAASTASSLECSFTPSWIHPWIHAQDCFESDSSSDWLRMNASYWPLVSQSTESMAQVVCARWTSAPTLKYDSSGNVFVMRALNWRSEMPFITSLASSLPCTERASSTALLRTGIHIFGITSDSPSFSLTISKGRSWNVTEPANSFAKAARRSSRTVTTLLEVPAKCVAATV